MNRLDVVIDRIRAQLPEVELRLNEPMSEHCSFRIGGPAAAMLLPSGGDDAVRLCELLRQLEIKPLIMGNGTNLLVTDSPLERIVIKMGDKISQVRRDGQTGLTAECGVTLSRLAMYAQERALTGLEFAHGIPGTLGGAVSMNAGAYGGQMSHAIVTTRYIDERGEAKTVTGDEHEFGYRHSMFSDSEAVILSCGLNLEPGEPDRIMEKMRELSARRRASQPLDRPSAGSTFKRPRQGYAAALIDEAGLKGFAVGGAQVSEKHAGFVVNRGGATFGDVLRVMEHVKETIYKNTGIELEPEVKIIR